MIMCYKCDGTKINIKGSSCKKCNGTGQLDNQFLRKLMKMMKEEISCYATKSF